MHLLVVCIFYFLVAYVPLLAAHICCIPYHSAWHRKSCLSSPSHPLEFSSVAISCWMECWVRALLIKGTAPHKYQNFRLASLLNLAATEKLERCIRVEKSFDIWRRDSKKHSLFTVLQQHGFFSKPSKYWFQIFCYKFDEKQPSDKFQQRLWLVFTYHVDARGGEAKFLNCGEWLWDSHLEDLECTWRELKTLDQIVLYFNVIFA